MMLHDTLAATTQMLCYTFEMVKAKTGTTSCKRSASKHEQKNRESKDSKLNHFQDPCD